MNKKGISVMIGYILLITGAVIMSTIIYQWLKTYVPRETIECSDGISVQIKKSTCTINDSGYNLKLGLTNSGRFSFGGYFIHATNETYPALAVIDLTDFHEGGSTKVVEGALINTLYVNAYDPGSSFSDAFTMPYDITSVEIIPIQFRDFDNKKRLVACGNERITENIICKKIEEGNTEGECTDTCESLGYECGEVCGVNCGSCLEYQNCINGNCMTGK